MDFSLKFVWPKKSMKKTSPNKKKIFFNNVPAVLRLILNANIFDFDSAKLKLSAIFSNFYIL